MDPVIFIELSIPDVPPLSGFEGHTALLTAAHRFKTHLVLGFCASDLVKGPGVDGVFNEVQSTSGEWTLEIALELPDLLPSIDGKSEATLDVKDALGSVQRLCLSNRMSRFHYQDGTSAYHALLPRTQPWHGTAGIKGSGGETLVAAEEQLKTVAAMRFLIRGDTTERAFESSVVKSVFTLLECVNIVLRAVGECRAGFTPTARRMQWDRIPFVYVLVSSSGNVKGARLALNGARVALTPEGFEGDRCTVFRGLADGSRTLDDVDRLVGEAQSSWHDGEYEFAFLQAVIAAEIATARAVRAECVKRGVSNSKLNDTRKEMTYSWALNVGLPLCFPKESRPRDALIAAMNAARSKRNDLMHEAAFAETREQIGQLLADTREYLNALKAATGGGAGGTSRKPL